MQEGTEPIGQMEKENGGPGAFPDIGKSTRTNGRGIVRTLAPIFILLLLAALIYSSVKLYTKIKSPAYQEHLAAERNAVTLAAVGKLIELPAGTPALATVTDANTLKKEQRFFLEAENGDILILFSTEAIIYRPGIKKIVNVAPVDYQNSSGQ